MPRLFTLDHKLNRVTSSKTRLARSAVIRTKFASRYCEGNIYPSQHARNQGSIETVGCSGGTWNKKPNQIRHPTRSWPKFFGMHAVSFTLITSRKVKESSATIIQCLWKGSTLSWSKNSRICRRRKFFFIKKIHVVHLLFSHDDSNPRIEIWTATPSRIYSRFSPLRLLSVSKPIEILVRNLSLMKKSLPIPMRHFKSLEKPLFAGNKKTLDFMFELKVNCVEKQNVQKVTHSQTAIIYTIPQKTWHAYISKAFDSESWTHTKTTG